VTEPVVLILGGGVHGAAIARELLLNHVPVRLVERADLAFGATAKSSRLIHGGLRYLEFGDLKLVRESLAERQRLLELAPHSVRPLRLYIPVRTSWTGLLRSAAGFLGGRRAGWAQWLEGETVPRGFWPTRIGLGMYDFLSGSDHLPPSSTVRIGEPGVPRVDPRRYTAMLAYSDAQMLFPERLVLALLADAAAIAKEHGIPFDVHTRSEVQFDGGGWCRIMPQRSSEVETRSLPPTAVVRPRILVNATGAWGDFTREMLGLRREPLFGGTKGSHLVTFHPGLKEALQGQAVYAEADDGRLVFVLPFGEGVLIGTTDERFTGPPETATVSQEEKAYLLKMVNEVFALSLTEADVAVQYSGVRPLPKSDALPNAAISRDHQVVWEDCGGIPLATLVGGKLTTWRAFAEKVSDEVLERFPRPRTADTAARPIPGNERLPLGMSPGVDLWRHWAEKFAARPEEVAALWPLFGTRLCDILQDTRGMPRQPLADGAFSPGVVRWVIRHEWVATLEDLVERRLMLVFAPRLSTRLLEGLAECLVAEGVLSAETVSAAVERCRARLRGHYGRVVD
jgi:glycerol-3-phosphate dehydrogenase